MSIKLIRTVRLSSTGKARTPQHFNVLVVNESICHAKDRNGDLGVVGQPRALHSMRNDLRDGAGHVVGRGSQRLRVVTDSPDLCQWASFIRKQTIRSAACTSTHTQLAIHVKTIF